MGTTGTLVKCVSTLILLTAPLCFVTGQRITTIQLDGTQYFVSRMNPYSPELNYFLAYQYCRSLGLQLASFETKEKADSITQYLRNAGYNHYDFWTSGNRLGTDMLIWMSSGLPFNATFNYMRSSYNGVGDEPAEKQPAVGDENIKVPAVATGRKSRSDGMSEGCVVLRAPEMDWDVDDCAGNKDFICEQTRCYYYNYGSIPVSSSQGVTKVKPTQTTTQPTSSSEFASTTPPGELSSSSNLTVNRRATLRPAVPTPTTLPSLLATLMSETDEEDGVVGQEDDVMENLASRAFPLKEAGANVVYVTAVGIKNTPGGSDVGAASTTGDGWTATTDQI